MPTNAPAEWPRLVKGLAERTQTPLLKLTLDERLRNRVSELADQFQTELETGLPLPHEPALVEPLRRPRPRGGSG
jgi:hypothetical protein